MDTVIQKPSIEGNWLFKDQNEIRKFAKEVVLPYMVEQWQECTAEEKQIWEETHNN